MSTFVIPTIFSAIDRVTPVAARIEASIAGIAAGTGTSTAALASSMRNIGNSMLTVATNAALVGAAIVVPLYMAVDAAIEFEKALGNINTVADQTQESIKAIGNSILDVASKTPLPLADLSEAMYQIYSDGYNGAKALDILNESAKLAVTGLSTGTEAAASIASAINVFASEGITAAEAANQFFKVVDVGRTTMAGINESFGATAAIVQSGGVSFAEFNAAVAAMTISGMTASEAMTAIRGAVIAMVKPTGEMEKAFRSLGVTTGQQLVQKMHGLVPAMQAVGDAAKKHGLNVNEEFGRVQGLTAYTLLTGSLRGKFEQDLVYMRNGVDELGQGYSDQMETTAAKVQIAKNAMTELAIRTGNLLLPTLGTLAQVLAGVIGWMSKFAENHSIIAGMVTGGVATFGAFAVTVAGLAGAFYVAGKAIWLVQIAVNALSFAQGILAVVTNSVSVANMRNTTSLAGARIAQQYLTGVTWQQVLANRALWVSMGLVGVGLAIIASRMGDDYTVERYNSMLDGTKDKFESIQKPIEKAALAMEAYNEAMRGHNEAENFIKRRAYNYERGEFDGIAFDLAHPLELLNRPMYKKMLYREEKGLSNEPNPNDFPGLDRAKLAAQQAEDAKKTSAGKQDTTVIVNLQNNGGALSVTGASTTGGGSVTPVVTTTHNPVGFGR